jgi:hypothetical protein
VAVSVVGIVQITCPGCGLDRDVRLVQSINTRSDAAAKQQLLAGKLNVFECACGRISQLAANVLFHDPDAEYYARVIPGGDAELAQAAALFRASGATGRLRVVPSLNALVEKVKLLDAGLEDWAIELAKVLLLAGGHDLERVLLFDRVDRERGVIHWILFDETGRIPRTLESALAAHAKLLATARPPAAGELQIDRAWAVGAAQALIYAAN